MYHSTCVCVCVCVCLSIHGHAGITNAVRSSEYFQSLLPLSAECLELDGNASSLPIIFEDSYAEQTITLPVATTNSASNDQSNTTNSQLSCSSRGATSSRQSRMSVASSTSAKLRVRPLRTESLLSRGAGDSLVATERPDCTLVGYRKIDISSNDFRPTVELGTLTSEPRPPHMHMQAALVGSGVVMQPSLLFNAVSLPTLHTTSATATDLSASLTGSMPTLAATENSASESEMTPYWRSQQGKAQLVAQHSSEATAITPDFSNNVDFTVGGCTVDSDLDTTISGDLCMAVGIDLDTTVDSVQCTVSEDIVKSNETAASACDSTLPASAADSDVKDEDADGLSVMTSAAETEAAAAETDKAICEDVTPSAVETDKVICEDVTPGNSAEDAGGVAADSTDDCRSLAVPVTSASLISVDNIEQLMDVTDKTIVDMSLQVSSSINTNSDQSVSELKQSSPDSGGTDVNSSQSVSDIVDELSVVIPSSCDSVSDDERYMSGQCTLMELISEADSSEECSRRLVHQPQQVVAEEPVRRRALGVSDVDVIATATDKSSRRLISVVSDDTVQFIGAKEKLRRQLSYSGYFYRLLLQHHIL